MTEARCPHCKADLRGDPIPDEYFVHRDDCDGSTRADGSCFCFPYGWSEPEDRFFSRKIGVNMQGVYDGVLFWQCPDCGGRWHRFTSGRHRELAEPYVNSPS